MKILTTIGSGSLIFFILCSVVGCTGEGDSDVAPMEKMEKEALYSTIQGFVGTWWNGSDLYPDPCGWTPIQGVSCDLFDGFWYVTALYIGPVQDNSLSCAQNVNFEPYLFELKHLRTLSIFNCFISPHQNPVRIPCKIWEKLSNSLESLEFRSNPGLIGQISDTFANLTKLQSLVLLEIGLTGELPANIANLVNLRRLVLARNGFRGRIPECFGGLTRLLIFDSSQNSLSGPLPLTLGSLTSLLKLDLSNNFLEGNIPMEFGNMKSLTLLDLRNNRFSGRLTQSIEEMSSLEELVLSNNSISGDIMGIGWRKLQKLVILDLSQMSLTGEIPASITELKQLRFLGLNNNNLTGNLSPKFASLPSISALFLFENNLTGKLEFPNWFFVKMGRFFRAWKNENLCYSAELITNSRNGPIGVNPCRRENTVLHPNSNVMLRDEDADQSSNFGASLGFSSAGIDGYWLILSLEIIIVAVLLNIWL